MRQELRQAQSNTKLNRKQTEVHYRHRVDYKLMIQINYNITGETN